MALFQYGFKPSSSSSSSTFLNEKEHPVSVPSHLPQHSESGSSVAEHANVTAAVSELANPYKKQKRGKYAVYTDEDRAQIGKYAAQNGNERARKHFSTSFPSLTESTVRNFKSNKLLEEMILM